MPILRLITDRLDDAATDTALSTVLLQQVARAALGPTVRLFVPTRAVAFGSQDRIRPGYAAAVRSVEHLGFAPIERLAGGTAAVFHEGTLAFAWATPERDPKRGIEARYEAIASIVIAALAGLGVPAAIGETPGEYCPGRYSVHSRGRKVMGVGQRLVAGAAHVGGVLVAHSPELINRALGPAYSHLGHDWDEEVTGAANVTVENALDAMTAAFEAAGHTLEVAELDEGLIAQAHRLAPRHRPRIA